MSGVLNGKRVAVLVDDGFEQTGLTWSMGELAAAGADVDIVSPTWPIVRGWKHDGWADDFAVTRPLREVQAKDYDALLLPGGLASLDRLRVDAQVLGFVRGFFTGGKAVAAIGHGPQLLIDAAVAHGRRLTSVDAISADLRNAGAAWVDEAVVVDHGLVTSRSPADLPLFISRVIAEFASEHHAAMSGAGPRE